MKRLLVIVLALLLSLTACAPTDTPTQTGTTATPNVTGPAPTDDEPTPRVTETPIVEDPVLYTRDIHAPALSDPPPFSCPGYTEEIYIYKPDEPMTLDEIAYKLGEMWLNSLMGVSEERTFSITEWRALKPVIYDGPFLYYRMQMNELVLTTGQYLVNFSAEYRYTGDISNGFPAPDIENTPPDGFTNAIWPPQGSGEGDMFLMEQTGDHEYTLRTFNNCIRISIEGQNKQYLDEAREWLKNLSESEIAAIEKYMPTESLVVSAVNLNPPYMDATAFLVSEEPGWERESFIVYRRPLGEDSYDFFAPALSHSEDADNCVDSFVKYVQRRDYEGYASLNYEGVDPEPEVVEQWRRAFQYYARDYDLSSYTIDSTSFAWGSDVDFWGYIYNLKDAAGKPLTLYVRYGDGLVWVQPYTGN